jgi:hypothetical protein
MEAELKNKEDELQSLRQDVLQVCVCILLVYGNCSSMGDVRIYMCMYVYGCIDTYIQNCMYSEQFLHVCVCLLK